MANKPNRNDPCSCGSGKKYKNCCQNKDDSQMSSKIGIIAVAVAIVLGLIIVGMSISGGERSSECPPGTNWSSAHNHCH
ncbi:MAG: SEC-C metal-binding domain-containing protein [Balneolaceae bacterium]